jgi:hypothetical protein
LVRILAVVEEEGEMSSSHESGSWLERWGLVLVILYGLIFLTVLVSFHPAT